MSLFTLSKHSNTFILMFYIALVSSLCAIILSAWLIRKHITNFNSPSIQSKIIGILWMIPIYSFNSIFSLLFPSAAVYIDMMRDCYEAYVLYLFFSLLLSFLCGGNEINMIEYLETLPASKHPFPFNLCISSYLPTGNDYLRYAKFGTLQYCVIRPTMAILVFLFTFLGWYEEGNFNPLSGTYFYIAMTLNVSIAFAFSALLSFYYTFKYDLRPLDPVPKFLVIKSIIFCIFWQGLILALLVETNVIPVPSGSEFTKKTLTATLQDFIVCLEMSVAAIVNMYAFDYLPFAEHSSQIIGPYHSSNNLKSIPTVSEAYRQLKIPSNMPRKHRRPNNIRRSKDSQARSGSHSSTEELTESLLHSHDEEEGNDEEEVILNNQVRPYPAISKETQVKKERIPEKSSHKSNHKKEKKLVENHSVESSIAKDDFEESFSAPINLDFPENPAQIATFEVEDPVKLDTASSREKKKHFLSGKPLIGLYDRPQSNAKTNNTPDTLANRWLKAQQPKHNEIFHQQDTIENYNVDRSDNTPVYDIKGRSGEGEAFNTLLDKHFSHSTAVRHFNESMPVLVLPTGFSPEAGKLIPSNPNDRIKSAKNTQVQSLENAITSEEYTQHAPPIRRGSGTKKISTENEDYERI